MVKSLKRFEIKTEADKAVDITADVAQLVCASGIEDGICIVQSLQNSAGLLLVEPNICADMMNELKNMAPARYNYNFQMATPSNIAGSIKSVLTGTTLSLIIEGGKLLLGERQRIMLAEFDGPRTREYVVKCM